MLQTLLMMVLLAVAPSRGRSQATRCAAGSGISSADGHVCCPVSCGICGGQDCSVRFPGSAEVCCTTSIARADNTCGRAPCVISASTVPDALSVAEAAAGAPASAAAATGEWHPEIHIGTSKYDGFEDAAMPSGTQAAGRALKYVVVDCPNKHKCSTLGVVDGVSATCNEKSVCVCPAGYVWILDRRIDYEGHHRRVGCTCNSKGKCTCPKGLKYKEPYHGDDPGECVPASGSAKCSDGTTCSAQPGWTKKVACSVDDHCICLGANIGTGGHKRESRTVRCYCAGTTCGDACCGDGQDCFAELSGGGALSCRAPLKCAEDRQPCGHALVDGVPSVSTECCAESQARDVSERTRNPKSKTGKTRCVAPRTCPPGREACGGSTTEAGTWDQPYVGYTADTTCCDKGVKCWTHSTGTTRCRKDIKCPKGQVACGDYSSSVFDPSPTYYGYGVVYWGNPKNICCPPRHRCLQDGGGLSAFSFCE
ncbi:hypothetical protein JKP88DRAFT_253208 [Tribonema minus]|uniref:Uncharacterized protein n=1 Tax=Tribonema minus TaxID=303371 RepID=A0A835ZH78_9STRA|nr:hypothetical protein JKP88DRAFT_253208 [Tribonema minus]